jgi:hypothetical protein
MSGLTKQSAFSLLNLTNVDELNSLIAEVANHLKAQGKEVPQQFINPSEQESITKAHLTLLRDYKNGKLNAALPQAQTTNENTEAVENVAALTVSDDEILDIVSTSGVDLDVVMNAAAHVEDFQALVLWVEAYKELESEQAIKDSAKQQFELDQLRKKESELTERLNSALTKTPVNTAQIRDRLGVQVPKSITNLGKWDGKTNSDNAPDFLKSARAAMAKAGIGQN